MKMKSEKNKKKIKVQLWCKT